MRARTFLLSSCLLALAALPACFLFDSRQKPNIVLIVVHSLRQDALSQSSGAPAAPNMRALAREGAAFQSCFSHSPVALPALTAILSARPPYENRVMNNGQDVDENVALAPEWLQKQGFETFACVSLASLQPGETGKGLDRGFQEFQTWPREVVPGEEVVKGFQGFLERAPADHPWFAMLQFSEPNEPYDAHGEAHVDARILRDGKPLETISIADGCFWKREATLPPGTTRFSIGSESELRVRRFSASSKQGELKVEFERGNTKESAREIVVAVENPAAEPVACELESWIHDAPSQSESRKRYRLEVEAVDRDVGALIAELKRRNLYDQSLIVLTADHGESLGEHGHVGHVANLYDELLRVPLIIKPAKSDGEHPELARAKHELVRQIDIVPTLLDLAHVRSLPGASGSSLLLPDPRELIAETHPPEAPATLYAIRDGRYKLILGAGVEHFQMYDLQRDTLEIENIFPLEGHFKPEWITRLREFVGNSPQTANARMGRTLNRKSSPRLEALGY